VNALKKNLALKFKFSKKATKIDEIFTVDLMLCSKRQIEGEDFINFCGLFRKYELYVLKEIGNTVHYEICSCYLAHGIAVSQ
jgi:hypothetical protein